MDSLPNDLYKQALLQPSKKQQVYWKSKIEPSDLDRRTLIHNKIEEMKNREGITCFRCTESGHYASHCRNALVCFICNKLGHRANRCRSITSIPPKANPQKKNQTPTPSRTLTLDLNKKLMATLNFHASPNTERLEIAFNESFFITDREKWGEERMEGALQRLYPHQWVVRMFDEDRFLIQAPSKTWLDNALLKQSIRLENKYFSIQPWDPSYDEGLRLIPLWIRVRGFPMKLWHFAEFEHLFAQKGAVVLDLDPKTATYRDWRFARIRVGACDTKKIPSSEWITYRDQHGYVSRYEVFYEIEEFCVGGFNRRPGGGPPPPQPRQGSNNRPSTKDASSSNGPPRRDGKQVTGGDPMQTDPQGYNGTQHGQSIESSGRFFHPLSEGKLKGLMTNSEDQTKTGPLIEQNITETCLYGEISIPHTKTKMSPHLDLSPSLALPTATPDPGDANQIDDILKLIDTTRTSDINSQSSLMVTEHSSPHTPSSALPKSQSGTSSSPPPPISKTLVIKVLHQPRRSTRLKMQGMLGSVLTLAKRRALEKDTNSKSTTLQGNSLLQQFPFRATKDEIEKMFQAYRITLGQNCTQRDLLIDKMQTMPRSTFESTLNFILDRNKTNEKGTVVTLDNEQEILLFS